MKFALLILICEVVYLNAQQCTEQSSILNYIFNSDKPNIENNEWNYQTITSFEQCKQGITTDTKNFEISQVSLLSTKISLDVEEIIELVINKTQGPLVQYKTNTIKLTSWGVNNIARYSSQYLTIGPAEHNFDFWAKAPDAEIQVYFVQDQFYQNCEVEPLYAVLSIPVYVISETQNIKYAININVTNQLNVIGSFNFKQNILGAYSSDMTSFVSYKAPINIPPCGNANWFVLTQPQFIKFELLKTLLQLNAVDALQRMNLDGTYLNFIKGRFIYAGEDDMKDYDDNVEWAATWVASIIPCLLFALVVCIYGQYEISNIGRYKRPQAKQPEGMEQESLKQDDAADKKLT
ncbi:unnamed protein product (macronuclear) [Paramecium tetraurelia]|uniref:Transmembrane protein n=1 Tax=Paramecium tetraurelia TaxID=5888 RepID=A0BZB1_PARTE|nr:uncharacterized protein GSPATT00033731001 [Paramecium tetraurelia]CAK63878.1 unnamed protein product [Paramecium tetraurelia]|eukprot:XP_001431276.1 hypothetical protein (macronuclear) [Paramecium tetraurelia strain d4-2]